MIKDIEFTLFGRRYSSRQFPAVAALELFGRDNPLPIDILALTKVKADSGWVQLNSRESINDNVTDAIDKLPPRLVLIALINAVNNINFGFVGAWRGVKVPSRFTDSTQTAESKNADPLIASLISDDVASLRELEEYYSLEDAFKMFDIIVAKGVNKALANEAAVGKSKR
jgi:hypothetical protein